MISADKIKKLNDIEIFRLYENAIKYLEKPTVKAQAEEQIIIIRSEWARRSEIAMKFPHKKALRPEKGLLSLMGYNVGNMGAPEKSRRYIIDEVMTQQLPFIGGGAYMQEWGEPNSKKRYNKLLRTIIGFLDKNRNFRGMEKAVIEWNDDIQYIVQEYKSKFE